MAQKDKNNVVKLPATMRRSNSYFGITEMKNSTLIDRLGFPICYEDTEDIFTIEVNREDLEREDPNFTVKHIWMDKIEDIFKDTLENLIVDDGNKYCIEFIDETASQIFTAMDATDNAKIIGRLISKLRDFHDILSKFKIEFERRKEFDSEISKWKRLSVIRED